jgi:hypothetical protein
MSQKSETASFIRIIGGDNFRLGDSQSLRYSFEPSSFFVYFAVRHLQCLTKIKWICNPHT